MLIERKQTDKDLQAIFKRPVIFEQEFQNCSHPKMKILSTFILSHVVSTLYRVISSVEHKIIDFKIILFVCFFLHTTEVTWVAVLYWASLTQCMDKSSWKIIQNIYFCVPLKKETWKCLAQHENYIMTQFSYCAMLEILYLIWCSLSFCCIIQVLVNKYCQLVFFQLGFVFIFGTDWSLVSLSLCTQLFEWIMPK